MDREDPITQFFPDQDSVDLYAVLHLSSSATQDDIKKAYRRLALKFHPDKHAASSQSAKSDALIKFQQVGFAYAVLSDDKRRQRYDRTGRTDEGFELAAGEDGWEAYFEELFERVTKEKLDEMKKEYQGSNEELEDLKQAYLTTSGDIGAIMTHIPHSTHDDEPRIIALVNQLIFSSSLVALPTWEKSVKDEKAKLVRKRQAKKEAGEAEALAKELGVWDEFYGSGKAGASKGKGVSKKKDKNKGGAEGEEDYSGLQALMLKKKANMNDFFDGLAAKYAEPQPKPKGAKGKKKGSAKAGGDEQAVEEPPKKRAKRGASPPAPELDDEEFEQLQQRLFGEKAKATNAEASTSGKRATRASSRKNKS